MKKFLVPLLMLPAFIFGNTFFGWWRFDDTQLLKFVLENNLIQALFHPQTWQKLTASNFTPWVVFSYWLDLKLFGLNPEFFYFHHILSITALACVSWFFLRQWASPGWAAYGVILFLAGASVYVCAQQLMTRHYLEGLFVIVMSAMLFRKGLLSDRIFLSAAGAGFYFLAMSAKEIYVVFIAALLFWPEGRLQDRLRHGIFFFLSLILYVLWRGYMLGWTTGGYETLQAGLLSLSEFTSFFQSAVQAMVGTSVIGAWIFVLVLLFILFFLLTRIRLMLFASVWLCALILPVLPVTGLSSGPGRYFVLIWWSIAGGFSLVLSSGWKNQSLARLLKPVIAVMVILMVSFNTWQFRPEFHKFVHEHESTGRHIWNNQNSEAVYYVPEVGFGAWYLSGLIWIKINSTQETGPDAVIVDPYELYELRKNNLDRVSIWSYIRPEEAVMDIQPQLDNILEHWLADLQSMPLTLNICQVQGVFFWDLGPHSRGRYTLLTKGEYNVSGKVNLPQQGQRRLSSDKPRKFMLKYTSPKGVHTYSPWLEYHPERQKCFSWEQQVNQGDRVNNSGSNVSAHGDFDL